MTKATTKQQLQYIKKLRPPLSDQDEDIDAVLQILQMFPVRVSLGIFNIILYFVTAIIER